MTIDGSKVKAGTARIFPAIGGGYGMAMQLARKAGGDFVFGKVANTHWVASDIRDFVNEKYDDKDSDGDENDVGSDEMEAAWTKHVAPVGKEQRAAVA